jgi:hypothetical protein
MRYMIIVTATHDSEAGVMPKEGEAVQRFRDIPGNGRPVVG